MHKLWVFIGMGLFKGPLVTLPFGPLGGMKDSGFSSLELENELFEVVGEQGW